MENKKVKRIIFLYYVLSDRKENSKLKKKLYYISCVVRRHPKTYNISSLKKSYVSIWPNWTQVLFFMFLYNIVF